MNKKADIEIVAKTVQEFDAEHNVKAAEPEGIRPLMPMVAHCPNCERLQRENEELRAILAAGEVVDRQNNEKIYELRRANEALRELIEITAPHIIKEQAREIGAID